MVGTYQQPTLDYKINNHILINVKMYGYLNI